MNTISTSRPASLQWSIKDLLILIAMLSAFLGMMVYMGVQNLFFWTCTIASSIMMMVFVSSLPNKRFAAPRTVAILILVLLANPILMFFSLVMAINGLAHLVFVSFARKRESALTVVQTLFRSGAITLTSFLVGILSGLPGYIEFREARKEFAPVDLSQRLDYEIELTSPPEVNLDPDKHEVMLDRKMVVDYEDVRDSSSSFFGREWALAGLHKGQIESFVKSPGFGVGRFLNPSLHRARLPETRDIAFDDKKESTDYRFRQRNSNESPYDSFDNIHSFSVIDFVHPDSLGISVEPKVWSGFAAHSFHSPPPQPLVELRLELKSLQLISLRRFDSPRAYVLDHLPRMDQLSNSDVPTRELTPFEFKSIDALQEHYDELFLPNQKEISDVVFETVDDGVVMVGAVRAFPSCLECHNAKRLEMLGAFSYRFVNKNSQEANHQEAIHQKSEQP